jgi:hypothetical protein
MTRMERTHGPKSVFRIGFATLVALVLLAGPVHAADQYDEEDSNPLRVVSYVLYPVGTLIEYTVFRPLHFLGRLVTPTNDDIRHSDDENCRRERVGRGCTRAGF